MGRWSGLTKLEDITTLPKFLAAQFLQMQSFLRKNITLYCNDMSESNCILGAFNFIFKDIRNECFATSDFFYHTRRFSSENRH
jgi:hypothetical protein